MSENTENTPQINIADLANAVNIIDFASTKGAFTGPDIELVGKTRNRLQAFVEAHSASNENATESETTENASTESEAK